MTYQETLSWLYSTQHFGVKLGLESPRKLLRQFLATLSKGTKVIHVAGTNGKGSTCAIIDSIARASGIRCGLFTSPHLVDFRERVRVNGQMIPIETTHTLLTQLKNRVSDWQHHPTFFELSLALAMKHFKQMECELIILETGMGGRLDATTAIPADVCTITPIALDHSDWLGDTIAKVASEKAGIICPEKPVISAHQHPDAADVIAEEADSLRAPLTVCTGPLQGYSINLAGTHQAENAQLAIDSFTALGYPLHSDTLRHALSNIQWPGRFETITPALIIDGAHNPHAAHALVKTWQDQFPNQKANLIFGAVDDKDSAAVLAILAAISHTIHLTPIDSPRSLSTESLINALPTKSPPHFTHKNLLTAINSTSPTSSKSAPTLIAGSLFLIGEAKALTSNTEFQRSTQ